MFVDIHVVDPSGEPARAGSVWLEDGKIRSWAAPDYEKLIADLPKKQLKLEGREFSGESAPEEWLALLPVIYSGVYLSAEAHEGDLPDWGALSIINYELDLAFDRGTLDQKSWQRLYDRAVAAAHGNTYLLDPLLSEADPCMDYHTDRRLRLHRAFDRLYDDWNAAEHPRGQPENAGEFTSAGGGTGKSHSFAKKTPPHREAPGEIFVSPNVKENLTFAEAKAGLATERQRQIHRMAEHMAHEVTDYAVVENVIGDWSDGAENSMFVQTNIKDLPTLRYLAARMGDGAQQKAVIPFLVSKQGKDALWTIRIKGTDLEGTRRQLDESGLAFRTLDSHGGATYVHIFDPGSELREKVIAAAGKLGGAVDVARGDGEFLGGETRDEGIQAYKQVIEGWKKEHATAHDRRAGRSAGRDRRYDPAADHRSYSSRRQAADAAVRQRFHRALDRLLDSRVFA